MPCIPQQLLSLPPPLAHLFKVKGHAALATDRAARSIAWREAPASPPDLVIGIVSGLVLAGVRGTSATARVGVKEGNVASLRVGERSRIS